MSTRLHSVDRDVPVEPEAVIRPLFERIYSKGVLHLVDELVASDFTAYSSTSDDPYHGSEGMKAHVGRLRVAFHGFAIDIDALRVAGDAFEVNWTARGTHERPFMGLEPTCHIGPAGAEPRGTRFTVTGDASGVLTNEGIEELDMSWDMASLYRQLDGDASRSDDTGDEEGIVLPARFTSD